MAIRCARKKVAEVPSDEPRRIGEEKPPPWTILPTSRVRHFRVGFCFLWTLAEELLVWDRDAIARFAQREQDSTRM